VLFRSDRGAGSDYPTAIVVDEDSTQQQATCRRTQLGPGVAGVVCRVDRSAFTKGPAASIAVEDGAHENGVDIESFDLDAFPTTSAIGCLHDVSARLVDSLELISVYFTNQPAVVFVSEKDVAHDVVGGSAARFPGLASVESL